MRKSITVKDAGVQPGRDDIHVIAAAPGYLEQNAPEVWRIGSENHNETCLVFARGAHDALTQAQELWPDDDPWTAGKVADKGEE